MCQALLWFLWRQQRKKEATTSTYIGLAYQGSEGTIYTQDVSVENVDVGNECSGENKEEERQEVDGGMQFGVG